MNTTRAKIEKFICDEAEASLPGSPNREMYKKFFSQLDDAQFGELMRRIRDENLILPIVAPNFAKYRIDNKRCMDQAKRLGFEFFKRMIVPAGPMTRSYLTPNKYLTFMITTRRQAQHLREKISTGASVRSVDRFTDQVTGDSKASRLSFPEMDTLAAMGLKNSIVEQIKFRGGDERGFNAFNTLIDRQGVVHLDTANQHSSGVKVTHSVSMFLNAAHIRNNLTR